MIVKCYCFTACRWHVQFKASAPMKQYHTIHVHSRISLNVIIYSFLFISQSQMWSFFFRLLSFGYLLFLFIVSLGVNGNGEMFTLRTEKIIRKNVDDVIQTFRIFFLLFDIRTETSTSHHLFFLARVYFIQTLQQWIGSFDLLHVSNST